MEKKDLRKAMRIQRACLNEDPERVSLVIKNLIGLLNQVNPRSLGLYIAMPGEVDLTESLQVWAKAHHTLLALPYVEKANKTMVYRLWREDSLLLKDTAGILAPSVDERITPQWVIAPCVGYSDKRFRLGNGGGYFDRWLAQERNVSAIGLAFESLVVPNELFMDYDIPMTRMVTESRVF